MDCDDWGDFDPGGDEGLGHAEYGWDNIGDDDDNLEQIQPYDWSDFSPIIKILNWERGDIWYEKQNIDAEDRFPEKNIIRRWSFSRIVVEERRTNIRNIHLWNLYEGCEDIGFDDSCLGLVEYSLVSHVWWLWRGIFDRMASNYVGAKNNRRVLVDEVFNKFKIKKAADKRAGKIQRYTNKKKKRATKISKITDPSIPSVVTTTDKRSDERCLIASAEEAEIPPAIILTQDVCGVSECIRVQSQFKVVTAVGKDGKVEKIDVEVPDLSVGGQLDQVLAFPDEL